MKATRNPDQMPDYAFRLMSAVMAIKDFIAPGIEQRVAQFGIRPGMIVVDYGCGPGRYTSRFAQKVGPQGLVYAVDIQPLALQAVGRLSRSKNLTNIKLVLADGYKTEIPSHTADMVFALDMFFGVSRPVALLEEIHRILRKDGVLILDDGHQSRERTMEKIYLSALWGVNEANTDHIRLLPK